MKQVEILNKIEDILKNSLKLETFVSDAMSDKSNTSKSTSNTSSNMDTESQNEEQQSNEKAKVSPFKQIFNLIVSFFMSVIKAPFQLLHVYIKNEIIALIRKELKLYFIVMCLLGVLFTIFIVFYVLISLAVGFYFQELGFTNFESILLSVLFQIVMFIVVGFIFFKVSRKIRSLKMIRQTLKN